MDRYFASGNWQVIKGKEPEFVQRWTEFLGWTREANPGLISARLVRGTDHPSHFVSISEWTDDASRAAWKESEDFKMRLGACRALCENFESGDYDGAVEI